MRHQWDKPAGFERTCGRCGGTLRKYAGEGGYQWWPKGLGTGIPQWVSRIPGCGAA